ncbi:hypothetical protein DSUL_200007 [Desulfovibrionales bacterium]
MEISAIRNSLNEYMLDYRELACRSLDLDRLSQGSIIPEQFK